MLSCAQRKKIDHETRECVFPAYDMLNTLIVMPTDTEELALSINGKKRKITWRDFTLAMTSSGVPEKV